MSSATPPHSLHGVEQLRKPKRRGLRVLLYMPFAILVAIVLLLSAVGVNAKREARHIAAEQQLAVLSGEEQQATLPESCLSPDFAFGPENIWLGDQAATSEAVFAEFPEALGMRVEGRDGFNFWGDEQASNFSQALGRAPWLEEQNAQWLSFFSDLDGALAEQGRDLVIIVVPAKWELYRDKLPEWTEEIQGATHLDQFLAHSNELPIADVRGAMQEAKAAAPVYSSVNSHWSPYGATIAWQQTVNCGADLYPDSIWAELEVPEIMDVELAEAPNEYAEFGDASAPVDWGIPVFEGFDGPVESVVTADNVKQVGLQNGSVGLLEMPATTTSEQGVGTALILRDSTGDALSPIWSNTFQKTCQIRHNLDYPESRPDILHEAGECAADTVIYTFTERYFSQMPPSL